MNNDAVEAGVPERVIRSSSRRASAQQGPSPRSSLDRPSSLGGVLERRRAAEAQMAEVFLGLPEPVDVIPARVSGELGFILHAWDWSETSLLLDVLTVRYGRVVLVARGARRASSQYRGLLTAFCPLRFSWSGAKEAKMLTRAEWQGTMVPLTGEALLSGFYVNELVLKLTAREERHPGLFEAYVAVIHDLALGERDKMNQALRRFEMAILKAAGWAPTVSEEGGYACFVVRHGEIVGLQHKDQLQTGESAWEPKYVHAWLSGDMAKPTTQRVARDMLRALIEYHLDGRHIHSRRILAELNRLHKVP